MVNKKCYEVGDVFYYMGDKIQVTNWTSCTECYFYGNGCTTLHEMRGPCYSRSRPDNRSIMFVDCTKLTNNRNTNLSINDARILWRLGGESRRIALSVYSYQGLFEDIYLKSWEEYCDKFMVSSGESFIDPDGSIVIIPSSSNLIGHNRNDFSSTRIYKSYKSARSIEVLCRLIRLRDVYRDGWEPDWKNNSQVKYSIIRNYSTPLPTYDVYYSNTIPLTFSFPTFEVAVKFKENFKSMLDELTDDLV